MSDERVGVVESPVSGVPARAPGSVRRTVGLDMLRTPGPDGQTLIVRGTARDVVAAGHGADAPPARQASFEAEADVGTGMTLRSLTTDPPLPAVEQLAGLRAASGFRAAAAAALGPTAVGLPIAGLLDDLPIAAMLSGYVSALSAAADPAATAQSHGTQRDICAGWRSGATMMSALDLGHPIPLRRGPAAPPVDVRADPAGWHDEAPMLPSAMRRRRRIDVLPAEPDGTVPVDAMFRDTYRGDDGRETVVHEYALRAELRADPTGTLVVERIDADPRVLPWPECPIAASSATRLIGRPVAELGSIVRREFTGTSTCTHLNDLLRSLAAVPAMLELVGRG